MSFFRIIFLHHSWEKSNSSVFLNFEYNNFNTITQDTISFNDSVCFEQIILLIISYFCIYSLWFLRKAMELHPQFCHSPMFILFRPNLKKKVCLKCFWFVRKLTRTLKLTRAPRGSFETNHFFNLALTSQVIAILTIHHIHYSYHPNLVYWYYDCC